MNRHTGRRLDGAAHLAQSVVNILSTPKGSLVMLRDYGSDLPNIIDQPINGETLVDVYMATAEALAQWEPRIQLVQVKVVAARAGAIELELYQDVDGARVAIPIAVELAA